MLKIKILNNFMLKNFFEFILFFKTLKLTFTYFHFLFNLILNKYIISN